MQTKRQPSFFTLLLMISFASVNAMLFTPALPDITHYFVITSNAAQQTMTWFLAGYALGQLIYSPIANRFGRKPALYVGIGLQIVSSFLCVLSGMVHIYSLLVVGRFLLALGSGVGLKMTFTIVNECYEPKTASQKISYLLLAFAVTPGLGVALGGILNEHFGWMSCFYVGAFYGLLLLVLVSRLPETLKIIEPDALQIKHMLKAYTIQFKESRLLAGGILMGGSSSIVYVFATLAPFLAIHFYAMSSAQYGIANIIPPIGLIVGSVISARLVKYNSLESMIRSGILIASIGTLVMLVAMLTHLSVWFSLFLPMIIIYFGICFILANASTIALSHVEDKAHGSAVLNFLNVGLATIMVLSLSFFSMEIFLLPIIYFVLCGLMVVMNKQLVRN
ncbi:MFS transporter [soil metagenome]